ncbi:Kinase protein with adenine nucleotide alpha hydrolases-like domain, putative isoform 4 [Hibiscus syriacus]|uniref:Kinase protein with adenine nucleotide alpha hydrolases-like domain, putative isoform 4 n=1 Tax=Hibiscus syriacus TaxID=106335 RepID=A0A6A3AXL8_HIBSY|nr:Kinase protein with adenine nucleotide alpha hydrolases-like domain, putative isoform 4 [Hibiscus syriacus]
MLNDKKNNVLVGIPIDSQSRELLNWAIVKVAEPGDCVVAVHVSRCSDRSLESYLEAYEGLCSLKKSVELKGLICNVRSTREVLIREAKNYASVTLVVGVGKHGALGRGFEISSFEGVQSSKDGSRTSSDDSKSEAFSVIHEGTKVSSSSYSVFAGDSMDYKPGWPLLLRGSSTTPQAKLARNISVVQWVMNLPSRSLHHSPQSSTNNEIEWSGNGNNNDTSNFSMPCELQKHLETPLRRNASDFQWFSYEVLKSATAQFSLANLIGKGGTTAFTKGSSQMAT